MLGAASLEAEQRLISLCCEDLSIVDMVQAQEQDFADIRWKSVIRTLRELRGANKENSRSDALFVFDAVRNAHPSLGYSDLNNLDAVPELIERYDTIVRENGARRRLTLSLSVIQDQLKDGAELDGCLSELGLATAQATVGQKDQSMSIKEIIDNRFTELADIADRKAQGFDASTGIPTGIGELDAVIVGGIQKSIVTLIAARPAEGKSMLALNIIANANRDGVGCHVFSLEDPREKYADRVLSLSSRVSTTKIGSCEMSAGELGQLRDGAEKARKRSLWLVDDRSGISAQEIVRSVRRRLVDNQTRLVLVDYINLIRRGPGQSKRDAIDEAVNVFGDAAKQDKIAYLVLAQLNRDVSKREGNARPQLSDLKECGTLEERAKAVLLLHSPEGSEGSGWPMEIIVRKNSNGETGIVKTWVDATKMKVGARKWT